VLVQMRLILPSSAVLGITLQFDGISSIASSVLDATTFDKGEHEVVGNYSSEECALISSSQRNKYNIDGVDTGILNCAQNYECIPDSTSSSGGRCVSVLSDGKLATVERTLQCDKCVGTDACKGLDQSFIDTRVGCGSCIGTSACEGLSATSQVGENSCIGYKTCYYAQDAFIGSDSCTGDSIVGGDGSKGYACAYLHGVVGNNSCYEYGACFQEEVDEYIFNVGDNSCRGQASCMYLGTSSSNFFIADGSCNGSYSCYDCDAGVGNYSCNAKEACKGNREAIGQCTCNTDNECEGNTVFIPSGVCPATSAPTTKPTAADTQKPTLNPTSKPSLAPTEKPTQAPMVRHCIIICHCCK